MDDPPRYEQEPPRGMPRWAKVLGLVVAIVALLVVVMMLLGGAGSHNPLRHFGERAGLPPAGVAGDGPLRWAEARE